MGVQAPAPVVAPPPVIAPQPPVVGMAPPVGAVVGPQSVVTYTPEQLVELERVRQAWIATAEEYNIRLQAQNNYWIGVQQAIWVEEATAWWAGYLAWLAVQPLFVASVGSAPTAQALVGYGYYGGYYQVDGTYITGGGGVAGAPYQTTWGQTPGGGYTGQGQMPYGPYLSQWGTYPYYNPYSGSYGYGFGGSAQQFPAYIPSNFNYYYGYGYPVNYGGYGNQMYQNLAQYAPQTFGSLGAGSYYGSYGSNPYNPYSSTMYGYGSYYGDGYSNYGYGSYYPYSY